MQRMPEAERPELVLDGLRVPRPDALLIGGAWRPATATARTPVISPATEAVIAEVAMATLDDADAAASAAAEAFRGDWPRWPVARRVEVCSAFCARLEQRLDDCGLAWALEAGMPLRWSRTLHRFAAKAAWSTALAAAAEALAPGVRSTPVGEVRLEHDPVGPVLAVMPYNGPLATIGSKVIPALLAGAPVVVKAAPETALTMRLVSACALEAGFPPGVLSILPGGVEISRHLVRDPRFELISFTGGPRSAIDILRASADRLPRTIFELGGKSPAVLLPDVDLEQALRSLVAGAMSGSGQICAALSRLIVPRARRDEIVEAVAGAYRRLRIGDPRAPDTDQGPLANRDALERVQRYVATALEEGASLACGGGHPADQATGYYFEPTLLTGVAPGDTLAQEEVFGPVTAVLAYDDEDEAIAIANDSDYGLAASVYSADRTRAFALARRIRAGSVAVNAFGPTMAAPFGGVKRSGWGRECGPEGLREFTALKQILLG